MANLQIPITKAGKTATIAVDTDLISIEDGTYEAIFAAGLKVFLNAKMSKLSGVTKLEGAELEAAHTSAMSIAEKNLSDIYNGEIGKKAAKKRSATTGLGSRAEVTRAVQLAREWVRDQLKARNIRPGAVPAADITATAKDMVATNPVWLAKAREALAAQANVVVADTSFLDSLHESPALKAKAAEKSKKSKAPGLSAKQAGIPTRRKPAPEAHAVH